MIFVIGLTLFVITSGVAFAFFGKRYGVLSVFAAIVVLAATESIFILTKDSSPENWENVGLNSRKIASTNPPFRFFQGDGRHFMLQEDLVYKVGKTGEKIIIPAGFVTDYASVPPIARSIIPAHGRHSVASIVHDYLYWEQGCSRKEADDIMYNIMAEYGSWWTTRQIVYAAVRIGASLPWNNNARDRKKGLVRIVPVVFRNIPPKTIWKEYRGEIFKSGARSKLVPGKQKPKYCGL